MAENNNSSMGVIVGIVAIVAIFVLIYFVILRMQLREVPKENSPGIILELNGGSGNKSSAY